MNVSGAKPAAQINLDEFERRLRAAGTQQANSEDPLAELAKLLDTSPQPAPSGARARPPTSGEGSANRSEPVAPRKADPVPPAVLRPALDPVPDPQPQSVAEPQSAPLEEFETPVEFVVAEPGAAIRDLETRGRRGLRSRAWR